MQRPNYDSQNGSWKVGNAEHEAQALEEVHNFDLEVGGSSDALGPKVLGRFYKG